MSCGASGGFPLKRLPPHCNPVAYLSGSLRHTSRAECLKRLPISAQLHMASHCMSLGTNAHAAKRTWTYSYIAPLWLAKWSYTHLGVKGKSATFSPAWNGVHTLCVYVYIYISRQIEAQRVIGAQLHVQITAKGSAADQASQLKSNSPWMGKKCTSGDALHPWPCLSMP